MNFGGNGRHVRLATEFFFRNDEQTQSSIIKSEEVSSVSGNIKRLSEGIVESFFLETLLDFQSRSQLCHESVNLKDHLPTQHSQVFVLLCRVGSSPFSVQQMTRFPSESTPNRSEKMVPSLVCSTRLPANPEDRILDKYPRTVFKPIFKIFFKFKISFLCYDEFCSGTYRPHLISLIYK